MKKQKLTFKYDISKVVVRAKLARLAAKLVDLSVFGIVSNFFGTTGLFLGISYLAVADAFFEGESLGKKVLGIRVIDINEKTPCSLRQSFVRNIPIFSPLFFLMIDGWGWVIAVIGLIPMCALEVYLIMKPDSFHRIGDVLAETTVIGNDPHGEESDSDKASYMRWQEQDQSIPIHRLQSV